MKPWVVTITSDATRRLLSHAELVGLANTEEFTFRSMFMAQAAAAHPSMRFQTEWKRFDLLAQSEAQSTLIEFKYYVLRRTSSLDGTPGGFKGGAGPKNESEFWRCVEKIATQVPDNIGERFLVLIYEREYGRRSRYSFHTSFGSIRPKGSVTDIWSISDGPLEGRVLKIAPHGS